MCKNCKDWKGILSPSDIGALHITNKSNVIKCKICHNFYTDINRGKNYYNFRKSTEEEISEYLILRLTNK